jgi:hypothetical protein
MRPENDLESGQQNWASVASLCSRLDSKIFTHLQGLNIYGDEFTIIKKDCVNHISKRLRTGLRNIIK